MAGNLANAGIFLINIVLGIYVLLVMARFLMQVSRVDFYNPICQGIVKITNPPILPLRRVLPTIRGVDLATLTVALLVQVLAISLVIQIAVDGVPFFQPLYIAWAALAMFSLILDIYFYSLIVLVIASWIAPQSMHPGISLIRQITEPICAPARKLLPPMGGLDFSLILLFIAIVVIDDYLVVRPIANMLGVPLGLIPTL